MYYEKLIENNFEFNENVADYYGGGYIMNDGKFLSLNKNKKLFDRVEPSASIHHRFDKYLIRMQQTHKFINRVLIASEDNAIAINDGSIYTWEYPYVDLPFNELTEEQYASLLAFFDKVAFSNKKEIDIGHHYRLSKKETYKRFNLKETLPEDIIKYIKSLYNTPND